MWKIRFNLFFIYFIFSILLNIVGLIIARAIQAYDITQQQAGSIEAFKDLAGLSIAFLTACFLGYVGYKRAILFSLFLLLIGCVLIGATNDFWILPLSYGIIGGSFVITMIAIYSLAKDLVANHKEHIAFLNILEGVFGLGAIAGPLIFLTIMQLSSWKDIYWVAAVMAGLALLTLWRAHFPRKKAHAVFSVQDIVNLFAMFKIPLILCLLVVILFYAMTEMSFMNWFPSFNEKVFRLESSKAAAFVSMYAALAVAGKFATSYLIRFFNWFTLVITYVISGICLMSFALFTPMIRPEISAGLMALVGFFIGPIFPTITSVGLYKIGILKQSILAGMVLIAMSVGNAAGTMIIATIAQYFSYRVAFVAVLLFLIVIGGLSILFRHLGQKKQAST